MPRRTITPVAKRLADGGAGYLLQSAFSSCTLSWRQGPKDCGLRAHITTCFALTCTDARQELRLIDRACILRLFATYFLKINISERGREQKLPLYDKCWILTNITSVLVHSNTNQIFASACQFVAHGTVQKHKVNSWDNVIRPLKNVRFLWP